MLYTSNEIKNYIKNQLENTNNYKEIFDNALEYFNDSSKNAEEKFNEHTKDLGRTLFYAQYCHYNEILYLVHGIYDDFYYSSKYGRYKFSASKYTDKIWCESGTAFEEDIIFSANNIKPLVLSKIEAWKNELEIDVKDSDIKLFVLTYRGKFIILPLVLKKYSHKQPYKLYYLYKDSIKEFNFTGVYGSELKHIYKIPISEYEKNKIFNFNKSGINKIIKLLKEIYIQENN